MNRVKMCTFASSCGGGGGDDDDDDDDDIDPRLRITTTYVV